MEHDNALISISEILIRLRDTLPSERISIADLLEAFHERGFGFILLIFSVPMALPIPVPPGINVLLATPLILLTAQQALGRHTIWLPEKVKNKTRTWAHPENRNPKRF